MVRDDGGLGSKMERIVRILCIFLRQSLSLDVGCGKTGVKHGRKFSGLSK